MYQVYNLIRCMHLEVQPVCQVQLPAQGSLVMGCNSTGRTARHLSSSEPRATNLPTSSSSSYLSAPGLGNCHESVAVLTVPTGHSHGRSLRDAKHCRTALRGQFIGQ